MQPHKLAPHLQAVFSMHLSSNLQPVKIALQEAIDFLLKAEPTQLDLKNPDYGIPYALEVEKLHNKEEVISACHLLRMCLHAIERGKVIDSEKHGIPLLLSSIAGFVPDRNKKAAKKPRPNAKKNDDLDDGIEDAIRALPPDSATWKDILNWLDREYVIYEWSSGKFKFQDEHGEKTLTEKTFRHRLAKIRKKKFKLPD